MRRLLVGGLAIVLFAAVVSPASGWQPGWSIVSTEKPRAETAGLGAVSCATPAWCVAVGNSTDRSGVGLSVVERWDGVGWQVVPTPHPLGASLSSLSGVACVSASSCIAVGQWTDQAGDTAPLVERSDGSAWRRQRAPNPAQGGGQLSAVACPSATACVAVGSSNAGGLAERWNGTSWQIDSVPIPAGAQFRSLSGVSCSSPSLCTAVGSTDAGPLVERWNGSGWQIQLAPNPAAGGGALSGVACVSASACVAVGGSNAGVGLVERWQGGDWSIEPVPDPPGAQFSFLIGVSCASVADCTAVGAYGNGAGTLVTLAERWNGSDWTVEPTPSRADAAYSVLSGVSCPAASACTAVGPSVDGFWTPVSLAERWNGVAWTIQATANLPGAADSGLFAVACASAADCMSVGGSSTPEDRGRFLAERWHGGRWRIVPTPAAGEPGALFGVACASRTDCEAVGTATRRDGVAVTLAERWDGARWAIVPTPNSSPTMNQFAAVSCSGPAACTAVGIRADSSGNFLTLAETWNGHAWTIQDTPNPAGGGNFGGVACPAANLCFAAGSSNDGAALIEAWDGSDWRIQPAPTPEAGGVAMGPISCTSPTFCMATGLSNDGTLAERWNGSDWQIVPTPNPPDGGGQMRSISCITASACTVAGASNDGVLVERWDGQAWTIQPAPEPPAAFRPGLDGVACPTLSRCLAVGDYDNGVGNRVAFGEAWAPRLPPETTQAPTAMERAGAGPGAGGRRGGHDVRAPTDGSLHYPGLTSRSIVTPISSNFGRHTVGVGALPLR